MRCMLKSVLLTMAIIERDGLTSMMGSRMVATSFTACLSLAAMLHFVCVQRSDAMASTLAWSSAVVRQRACMTRSPW